MRFVRWLGWGLGVLIVGRLLVEVARIGKASSDDADLGLAMALNTAIVFAVFVVLFFVLGGLFSSRARIRGRALRAQCGEGAYLEVSKDPRLVRGLRELIPDAPDQFWRGGFLGSALLTTCRLTDDGIEFWWGGRVPELAGLIRWTDVRRVSVGSEVRGVRRDPAVEVWVSAPEGEVVLPLIIHDDRRAGFEVAGADRTAEVVDQLIGRLRAAGSPGSTTHGRTE